MEIKDDLHIPKYLPKKMEELKPIEEKFMKPQIKISLAEKANYYLDKIAAIASQGIQVVKAINSASNIVYAVVILLIIACLIFIGTKIF